MAGLIAIKPVDEIKIRLKHCDQCLFLQPMLSASIFKSIFEFRICIPNVVWTCIDFFSRIIFCTTEPARSSLSNGAKLNSGKPVFLKRA